MTKREEDKPKIIFFGDIVEENGKTIKENNLAREHKYPIGSLVELENGERLFVMAYTRDCDGNPLYNLGFRWNKETLSRNHGEEHIKFAPLTSLAQIEESKRGGQILFNDLAQRLIRHILEFNSEEHDIELNLLGIIAKAKEYEAQRAKKGEI